jgi:hypothetical protein
VLLDARLGHLTYSTLVHPADTWPDLWQSLTTYLPQVKARLSPDAPFGVSIRLSAATAATLSAEDQAHEQLAAFLRENDLYVYTANAFVYGSFKGGPVKERVYEPDWTSRERVEYTKNVAEILASIAANGIEPSIQTSPLGIKRADDDERRLAQYAANILEVAAHLVDLERRTGRVVSLAIEPEPFCILETTDETIDFFQRHLYSGAGTTILASLAGLSLAEAQVALRRHLGIVFNICHQAVEFEDIAESLHRLNDAGVPVLKLQEASAIDVPEVNAEVVDSLEPFTRTIYLTQTLERRDGNAAACFLNLEDALAAWRADPGPRHWRVHIHVPVFLESLGLFGSTQPQVVTALACHRETPIAPHLEVETYTWDVLPDELRTQGIVDDVCREVEWVRDQLLARRKDPDGNGHASA